MRRGRGDGRRAREDRSRQGPEAQGLGQVHLRPERDSHQRLDRLHLPQRQLRAEREQRWPAPVPADRQADHDQVRVRLLRGDGALDPARLPGAEYVDGAAPAVAAEPGPGHEHGEHQPGVGRLHRRAQTNSTVQPNRAVACTLPEGKDQDTGIAEVEVAGCATAASAAAGTRLVRRRSPGRRARPPPPRPRRARAARPGRSLLRPRPLRGAPRAQAALAGEPIPPATVAQGLRLPSWSMPFPAAFVLGGLFLGLRSWRRTRRSGAGTGNPAEAAGGAGAFGAGPGRGVDAAEPAGAGLGGQGPVADHPGLRLRGRRLLLERPPKDQPTGLSISSTSPGRWPRPGPPLTGTASVQAPGGHPQPGIAVGYTTLDAISDAFSVGLTVGSGTRQVLPGGPLADRQDRLQQPARGQRAAVLPLLQGAGRRQRLDQAGAARNEVVDRRPPPYQNGDTPPKVAVEFLASVTGNGTSATYIVSCWRNDDGPGSIATIPCPPGLRLPPGGTAPAAGTGTTQPGAAPGAAAPAGKGLPAGAGKATGQAAPGTEATAAGAPALQGAAASTAPVSAPAMSQGRAHPDVVGSPRRAAAPSAASGFAGWRSLLRSRALRRRPGA